PPGFTLVELLVALAIFGFLSSLVFGGVGLAIRSWTRAHDQVAGTADVWAVQGLLRRSLSGAYPALASRSAGDATIDFDGEPDALTLVAPMPQAVAVPVPARLRFFLAPDGRSRA